MIFGVKSAVAIAVPRVVARVGRDFLYLRFDEWFLVTSQLIIGAREDPIPEI